MSNKVPFLAAEMKLAEEAGQTLKQYLALHPPKGSFYRPSPSEEAEMTETEPRVSQPISPELRDLHELKRVPFYVEKDGVRSEYVTAEFHKAWSAELRARWERDIDLLNRIDAILTEAKTRGTDE